MDQDDVNDNKICADKNIDLYEQNKSYEDRLYNNTAKHDVLVLANVVMI